MRSQYGVEWIGDDNACFAAFAKAALDIGVDCRAVGGFSSEAPFNIRATAVHGAMKRDNLRALKSQLDHASAGKLAVLAENDPSGFAIASAIDCDDILILPADPVNVQRRLDNLYELSRLRAEWQLRERIVDDLVDRSSCLQAGRPARQERRLDVLMIGAIGPAAARLTDMLQPASIVFSEHGKSLAGLLQDQNVDLLIAASVPNDLDLTALTKPTHARWIWLSDIEEEQLRRRSTDCQGIRPDDRIEADMPNELLRARLRMQRRLATLGWNLTSLSLDSSLNDLKDTESGCFGATFAHAYLSKRAQETARPFTTIDLVPSNMPNLIEQLGYRGLTQWFGATAQSLGRAIRADDLLCHMGEGQFRVILQGCSPQNATNVANRLIDATGNALQYRNCQSRGTRQPPNTAEYAIAPTVPDAVSL